VAGAEYLRAIPNRKRFPEFALSPTHFLAAGRTLGSPLRNPHEIIYFSELPRASPRVPSPFNFVGPVDTIRHGNRSCLFSCIGDSWWSCDHKTRISSSCCWSRADFVGVKYVEKQYVSLTLRMTDGILEQPKLRKVLKPDVYQNFELAEKNVISHNTAS